MTLAALDLRAVTVGPERARPAAPVGAAIGNQGGPALASNGATTLIAWGDGTNGRAGVYAARLTAEGNVVEGSQRWLREAGVASISLSSSGSEYTAVWSNLSNGKVEAVRLTSDGEASGEVQAIADGALIDHASYASSATTSTSARTAS